MKRKFEVKMPCSSTVTAKKVEKGWAFKEDGWALVYIEGTSLKPLIELFYELIKNTPTKQLEVKK